MRRVARLSAAFLLLLGAAAGSAMAAGYVYPVPAPVLLVPSAPPELEYRYGELYDKGDSVPQNYAFAAYWYRQAAERGYPPAQLALARYYARGVGVPQDFILAYMWANLAASRLRPRTPDGDFALRYRNYAKYKLTEPQLTLAQQLASAWLPGTGPVWQP